jgi:nucleotide-binding universal stress UspA family protein
MNEKPIIVGVDESPEAARAALMGWRLAAAMGAPCRLIHAIPDVWATATVAQVPITPSLSEQIVSEAQRHIVAALSPTLPLEAVAAIEVKVGRAAPVLAECAVGAQLVVLGGKPHGALARGLGGSTAHYLVRSLDVPVLVVTLAGWPIQRVLAAVDLSFAAEPTIAAARRLAQDAGARLRLLHVVEPVRAPKVIAAHVDEDSVYHADLEAFNRLTTGLTEMEPGDRVMRRGPAADAVAEEAASWAADVVVVGSHGKGWVERLLVGSVTERLMAMLPASLLIVPVRPAAQPAAWPEPRMRERKGTLVI